MKSPNYSKSNENFSPTFYITLISIIQSLAFGAFLVESKVEIFRLIDSSQSITNYVLQSIVVFFLIFLVWYEYAMGTSCFQWNYNLMDSALPFCYGIIQYLLIVQRLEHTWFWFLCAFLILSFVAYLNMEVKARDNKLKYPMKKLLGNKLKIYTYYFILTKNSLGSKVKKFTYCFILIAFVIWVSYAIILYKYLPEFWFLILANTMILTFILYRRSIWNNILNNS